jgi:hypothetical protein
MDYSKVSIILRRMIVSIIYYGDFIELKQCDEINSMRIRFHDRHCISTPMYG